jgi:hypothetical protein
MNLGRLNVAYGIVSGLVALCILLLAGNPLEVYEFFDAQSFGVIAATVTVMNAVLAVPCIIGGVFLLRYHKWARIFLIVISALNLLNPPLGTLLGAYGLWVLMLPEIEPLFFDTPHALRAGYRAGAKKSVRAAKEQDDSPTPRIVPNPKRAVD